MTRSSLRSLVGRAAEVDALHSVLTDARSGSVRIAVIEGEAGIGKSRVLCEAVAIAHDLGFRVLRRGCDEMEQDRPVRALAEALEIGWPPSRETSDGLAILLAGSTRPAGVGDELLPPDAGWVITEATVDAVEEVASAGPVVLAVEDLQWADPLTLRALRAIGRQLVHAPLAMLVTVRAGARGPAVDRAIVDLLDRGARRLVLAPADLDDAVRLAAELLGRPPGPRLIEQVARAGGNPLFVIELLPALDAEGAIALVDGRAEGRTTSLPPTLVLTLLRRLSLVPEDVLNLLRLASVLGSAFSFGELAALADRTVDQLLPTIVAAREAGLLVEAGDRLAFGHDRVRHAIYGDLSIAVRKGLHRQAGDALAVAGAPVERVAGHVVPGAHAGDAEAVRGLRQAAQQSAHRDPVTAGRLLERALEFVDTADAARDEIEAEMVEPLLRGGWLRDAETVARGVLARPLDPAVQLIARTALASTLSIGARYPESIDQLERAAKVAAEMGAAVAGRRELGAHGPLRSAGRRHRAASRAIDGGERSDNDYARCLRLQALSMAVLADADVHRAVAVAEQAVNVREQANARRGSATSSPSCG